MKLKDKDNTAWQKYAAGAISIACFLIIWQLVVSFTRVGLVMVGPIEVIKSFCSAFVSPIGRNTIQSHIVWSMTRVMIGFFMGSILGIVLGICMGWNKNVESFFRPLFELIRPITPIAWIPLSIVWFGTGESSKYFIIFLGAFANVTMNAYAGVKAVDEELMGCAKMLGCNNRQVFTKIVLPSCVPQIFAGLQIAIGSSWATVVAAEMVKSSQGVGWIIIKGQDSNSTTQIMVGILAVGIVGFLLAVIMRAIESKLCAWNVRGK